MQHEYLHLVDDGEQPSTSAQASGGARQKLTNHDYLPLLDEDEPSTSAGTSGEARQKMATNLNENFPAPKEMNDEYMKMCHVNTEDVASGCLKTYQVLTTNVPSDYLTTIDVEATEAIPSEDYLTTMDVETDSRDYMNEVNNQLFTETDEIGPLEDENNGVRSNQKEVSEEKSEKN